MAATPMKPKTCSQCVDAQLRRVNRTGFVERRVFTFFGYYPWECVMCRRKVYLRDQGGHRLP